MKALKTIWGLIVDDGRLASTVVIALILATIVSHFEHGGYVASILIWAGLVISLIVSVEHQLRLKTRGK